MRTIFRIAKLELSSLFFSPIGWLVLIIFLLQAATIFFDYTGYVTISQESSGHFSGLSADVYTHLYHGLFPALQTNLYLYMPLLTMGLLSRETGSGSIKLLLSSPVTSSEIVLGKYLSMVMFSTLLLAIAAIFVLIGVAYIDHVDVALLLSGLLGLFLLMMAYAAVGLFMSSLTSQQVVAAISTLAVLALLNFVKNLGQGIDWLYHFTYFISLNGRVGHLTSGLITSQDVLYFLLVSVFFITITILKLRLERLSGHIGKKILSYCAVCGVFFSSVLLTSRHDFTAYWDVTASKSQTVTVHTQEILKQIKQPVTVTIYVNVDEYDSWLGERDRRDAEMDFWQPYARFLPNINIRYVYYYDTPAEDYLLRANPGKSLAQDAQMWADAHDIDPMTVLAPAQIRKLVDLRPDENRTERVLTVDGRNSSLHWTHDVNPEPDEDMVAAAFDQLLEGAPVIGFLTGNEERSIYRKGESDYHLTVSDLTYKGSLKNKGFKCLEVPIHQPVPAGLATLVIAAPQVSFDTAEMTELRSYINQGGNVFILADPGTQHNLNTLLAEFGVALLPEQLARKSYDFGADHIVARLSPSAKAVMPELAFAFGNPPPVLNGAVGLKVDSNNIFKGIDLVETDPQTTWNTLEKQRLDSIHMAEFKMPANNKSLPVAVALIRHIGKDEQRILVCGSADLMSSKAYPDPSYINGLLTKQIFKWFSYGRFPVDVSRENPQDNLLRMTHQELMRWRIVIIWVLPAVLVIAAAFLLIYRNRR